MSCGARLTRFAYTSFSSSSFSCNSNKHFFFSSSWVVPVLRNACSVPASCCAGARASRSPGMIGMYADYLRPATRVQRAYRAFGRG